MRGQWWKDVQDCLVKLPKPVGRAKLQRLWTNYIGGFPGRYESSGIGKKDNGQYQWGIMG